MENRNLLMHLKPVIVPLIVIGIVVLIRVVPHAPNFTPVAAMALFGGVYLNKKFALALPILVMLLSDVIIGFHDTMPYVYGSFLLTGLLGIYLKKHKNAKTLVMASLVSSMLFFLITNFGVWAGGSMYPKTVAGLMQSYYYALPFFRNTLLGDFFYMTLFFGGYEMALHLINIRKPAVK